MDIKITKKRLKTFLAYDTIKIIAVSLLVFVLTMLIFNALGKSPTKGQDYYLLLADNLIVSDEGRALPNSVKNSNRFGFSYEILKTTTIIINPAGYTSQYMLQTYTQISNDDVFITYDDGEDSLYNLYVNEYYAEDINVYIQDAKKYISSNNFIDDSGDIISKSVEDYFYKVHKKDSRFKTKSKQKEGIIQEEKRIKELYENVTTLEKVLVNHPELYYETEGRDIIYDGEVIVSKGKFAINLGKLNGKNGKNISSLYTYPEKDEYGKIVGYKTDKLLLMVGRNRKENEDLHFESIALINYLIDNYSTFIDEI